MPAVTVEGQLFESERVDVPAEAPERPAAEQKTFRPYDPDQVLLMAPVLQEWLPEGDLAHFVNAARSDCAPTPARSSPRAHPRIRSRLSLRTLRSHRVPIGCPNSR
jgi:hypothetical protein